DTVIEHPKFDGTLRRSSATCPCCGYTTPAEQVRRQFNGRNGGADDARLVCVVTLSRETVGRAFRLATQSDLQAIAAAKTELERRIKIHKDSQSIVPNEELPYLRSIFNVHLLHVSSWGHLFSVRQLLALTTLVGLIRKANDKLDIESDTQLST